MAQLILGVDFSGAAQAGEKIWVARAQFDGQTLHFDFLERAADLPGGLLERDAAIAALRNWIGEHPGAACGLDFPFSLERGASDANWHDFIARTADFEDALAFKAAYSDTRRRTDVAAKTPFSPLNLRLFRQTFHGIRDVLAPLAATCDILPFDAPAANRTWLMEICPASLLKRERLYLSYKGKSALQTSNRATIWAEMKRRGACDSTPEIDARALDDSEGDALDALLAALCVSRALASPDLLRARDEIDRFEGRVYF